MTIRSHFTGCWPNQSAPGPNREWIAFTLRPGTNLRTAAVAIKDAIWSCETLGTKDTRRRHAHWKQVEKSEQTGARSVRFTFNPDNREPARPMGMRPIL